MLTEDIIIFSKDRANRPIDKFGNNKKYIDTQHVYDEKCPFCRGNEKLTPNHTFKIENEDGWCVKSTLNKYPIIDKSSSDIYGVHEVMIETYRHNGSFYNMDKIEFENMLKMYRNRYSELIKDENIEYVALFKNYLNQAGASLIHPHTQITSLPFIPPEVKNKLRIAKEYFKKNNKCLYTQLIKNEIKENKRVLYNGKNFLVIIPYATRFSGEVRIIFKEKIKFENINDEMIQELGYILSNTLKKLEEYRGRVPFNMYMHTYPKNIDSLDYFNMHIHIVPRIFNLGGFELSTGIYSTSLIPEEYAKRMKFDR